MTPSHAFVIVALSLVTAAPVLGHDPHPLLRSLAANTAVDLGPYSCNQPPDDPSSCDTITDYSRFVYDPHNHQLLMFGGGHAATHRTDVDVFDFKMLRWTSAYPSTPCADMRLSNIGRGKGDWISTGHPIARHTYDMLVMADNIKRLVMLTSPTGQGRCVEKYPGKEVYVFPGKVALYDPLSKLWTYSPATADGWEDFASAEYDPVSGLIIVMDRYSVWTYDPVTHAKTQRQSYTIGPLGYAKNLVYFPPTRKMYYIADDHIIMEIDLGPGKTPRLRVTQVAGITGDVPHLAETGFAYDRVNRIIGGGVRGGIFYAYDPLAKRWTRRVMQPQAPDTSIGTVAFHALDYDPVNDVFIFLTDKQSGRRTWAYRYTAESASSADVPGHSADPQRRK